MGGVLIIVRRSLLVGLMLMLGGCGFQPIYGESDSPEDVRLALGSISVVEINSHVGFTLRNRLIDNFSAAGASASPVYSLAFIVRDYRQGLAVQSDSSVTRYNYRLNASFKLQDQRSGDVIFEGVSRAIAAYNVVESEFATVSARRNAEARAALVVGDDVSMRIASFFQNRDVITANKEAKEAKRLELEALEAAADNATEAE
jgi:LPS-assembly lipoprotein